MSSSTWTDERIETLRQLCAEGLSASQIANQLGGVSRNAVIGKLHRLGLAGRATVKRRKVASGNGSVIGSTAATARKVAPANPARKAAASMPKPKPKEPPKQAGPVVVALQRKTIGQLGPSDCRWPIGDPREPGFGFCGAATTDGKPFCAAHQKNAYAKHGGAEDEH